MTSSQQESFLTDRFVSALQFAHDVHRSQIRKDTTIPYVSHLLAVAGLVLESGGDEDLAIAGLLHDAVEDVLIEPIRTTRDGVRNGTDDDLLVQGVEVVLVLKERVTSHGNLVTRGQAMRTTVLFVVLVGDEQTTGRKNR